MVIPELQRFAKRGYLTSQAPQPTPIKVVENSDLRAHPGGGYDMESPR